MKYKNKPRLTAQDLNDRLVSVNESIGRKWLHFRTRGSDMKTLMNFILIVFCSVVTVISAIVYWPSIAFVPMSCVFIVFIHLEVFDVWERCPCDICRGNRNRL